MDGTVNPGPTCGEPSLSFDITQAMGLYSQLTGVLAGFAFTTIFVVLAGEHRAAESRKSSTAAQWDKTALVHLLTGFTGLVLASMQYASVSSELSCALILGRASSEQFLAGVMFGFAAMSLFFALVYLVEQSSFSEAALHFRIILTIVGPALALFFVGTAGMELAATPWVKVGDSPWTQRQTDEFSGVMHLLALVLPVTTLTIGGTALLVARLRKLPWPTSGPLSRVPTGIAYLTLAASVVATVRASLLSESDETASISHWEAIGIYLTCALLLNVQAVVLALSGTVESGRREAALVAAAGDTTRPSDE